MYSVYVWKDGSPPPIPSVLAKDIPHVDLYLRTSFTLDLDTRATALSGDSRHILVGCEDGTVAALAWSGKVSAAGGMGVNPAGRAGCMAESAVC